MGKIKSALRKALNLPHVPPGGEKPVTVSPSTYDILIRANEQGERLTKMEAPYMVRTGNPFGDILQRRVDKGMNRA